MLFRLIKSKEALIKSMVKKKSIVQTLVGKKPETLIFYSFLAAALIGAFLLELPFATTKGSLSFIDALFMSTSAVCVTGLSVIDIGKDLTIFGQLVILALIQLGGLGLMTFSLLFLIFLGRKISIHSKLCIPTISQHIDLKSIKYSLSVIFFMTIFIEAIGSVLLFLSFRKYHNFLFAVYSSVFHSISAFCNAGFSLYSDSFIKFNNNPFVLTVLMVLIVLGGFGFIVVYELYSVFTLRKKSKRRTPFSLYVKIAVMGTSIFIIIGTVFIWILERHSILSNMPFHKQILNSIFLSVTSRTAGFNTINTEMLSNPTLFFLLFLMFVGGCPASTAGGIKIHTFFTICALTISKVKGLSMSSLFKRKIPDLIIDRAVTIFTASLFIIVLATFFLQISENIEVSHILVKEKDRFLDLLFEAVSAFGTVGLSTGVTLALTSCGKMIIILLMFLGRIGPLSLGIALQIQQKRKLVYQYPEEEILVS